MIKYSILSSLVSIFIVNSCFFDEKRDYNSSIKTMDALTKAYDEYLVTENTSEDKLYYDVMVIPMDSLTSKNIPPDKYPYINPKESVKIYYSEINGVTSEIDSICIAFWHLGLKSGEIVKINKMSHRIKIK